MGSILVAAPQPLTVALTSGGSPVNLFYDQAMTSAVPTPTVIRVDTVFWVPDGTYNILLMNFLSSSRLYGGQIRVDSTAPLTLNRPIVVIDRTGSIAPTGEIVGEWRHS